MARKTGLLLVCLICVASAAACDSKPAETSNALVAGQDAQVVAANPATSGNALSNAPTAATGKVQGQTGTLLNDTTMVLFEYQKMAGKEAREELKTSNAHPELQRPMGKPVTSQQKAPSNVAKPLDGGTH